MKKGITTLCLSCKKEVYFQPWQIRDGAKFCSSKCYQKQHSTGTEIKCSVCGILKWRRGSQIQPEGKNFCSRVCFNKAKTGTQFKRSGEVRPCVTCGLSVYFCPYEIKGNARFCSSSCARLHNLSVTSKLTKWTSIEKKMRDELIRRKIKYQPHFRILNKMVVDFFLPETNTVIECDGNYWHKLPENVDRDKRKNKLLLANGYNLFRFWEIEINTSVERCVDKVASI